MEEVIKHAFDNQVHTTYQSMSDFLPRLPDQRCFSMLSMRNTHTRAQDTMFEDTELRS